MPEFINLKPYMKRGLLFSAFVILTFRLGAQTCSVRGQNPGTAFPVCGVQSFSQTEVPLCGGKKLPGPCDKDDVTDQNPFWYKFTCFATGTLGFVITPNNIRDDYDWQLFDVTGRNVNDIYKDATMFVSCNWSGETGITGASTEGTRLNVCANEGQPLFSSMPTLTEGHEYLFLISHFTNSQSGYKIDFIGGTAAITDPKIPEIRHSTGTCAGNQIGLKLTKRMSCASLALDGSDFILPSGAASILRAFAPECNGFDMDSVILTFDRELALGDYEVKIKTGTDGNTLLDACGNEMPPATGTFTVYQSVEASFTYQLLKGCIMDTIKVSHDGADGVNIWNWQFEEQPGSLSKENTVYYQTPGDKTISLTVSNGHCMDTASATVTIEPKIRAAFDAPEILCTKDQAVFADRSAGSVNSWSWDFGNGRSSTLQDPEPFNYQLGKGEKLFPVRLTIGTEGGCLDSVSKNVMVVSNCNINVPSAFTPNHDGKNDFLYPSNAFNADNLVFRVFNRFGQLVFESKDWRKQWDGSLNGRPESSGTYVWTLSYVLKSTRQHIGQKGTVLLIR